MAEHLPFASASTKGKPGALMQQPGLNLILGRGGRGDVDFARDGQASAVVQVRLCHESEEAVSSSLLGRSEGAVSLSICRFDGGVAGAEGMRKTLRDQTSTSERIRQYRNSECRLPSVFVIDTNLFEHIRAFY